MSPRPAGRAGGILTGINRSAAKTQVIASTAKRPAWPDGDHEQGAEGGAQDHEAVAGQGQQRVGLLE